MDPTTLQKRLGDGFYEQRLVREQVAQLTGQRFLGDYTDDQAQYAALMNNALTFASSHPLVPGIALSAEQMAQLTSDIVWLVEQPVTLADGRTTRALVPQLYVRVQDGDLAASGALLAGRDVRLDLDGDLTNAGGTIAGRQLVRLNANNVHNLGARIQGDRVSVAARKDPQFVQYQIDALVNQNLYPVVQELQKVGMDFNTLSTAQKEALFSAAVQHGSGVQAKTKGADNVLERAISVAQTDTQAPSFPTYTRQDLVYGQVEDQMRAAEESKAKLISQQLQLERQKSDLLQQGIGANAGQLQRIQDQVNALDQKIGGITNQVNTQDQYIREAGQYLKEQAKEALGNGEQFIRDFYKARTEMYPSEAKRYRLEMESLLRQYRQEQIKGTGQ
ncbi:MAG: S-layer family protein [Burkholderiales bacterium]|nr:S-layer family protein [Burkholderiales bacterium]